MTAVNLNVRHLPDEVHAVLVRRAAARGMSLRAYVVEVLSSHCSLPTTDEWLADLEQLPTARDHGSGAAAVQAARDEEDDEIARAIAGR
jgi:plasmid stability protein